MTSDRPRIAGLADGHLDELFVRSGLSTETILNSKIYSASGTEASAILGYGFGPGMVFPYGSNGYARVKLDHAGTDGKQLSEPEGPRQPSLHPSADQPDGAVVLVGHHPPSVVLGRARVGGEGQGVAHSAAAWCRFDPLAAPPRPF